MNAPTAEVPIPCPDASSRGRVVPVSLLTKGMTPVKVERMQPFFDRYPDREAAQLLGSGFSKGFQIPSLKFLSRNLRLGLTTFGSGF